MPIERLLPELGSKAGERWEASPSLAGEVVLIRIRDVPVSEVRERIASTFHCVWEREGQTLILTRRERVVVADSSKRASELAAQVIEEALKALRTPVTPKSAGDALRAYAAAIDPSHPVSGSRFEAEEPLNGLSPQRRLILRTLVGIGPVDLARALGQERSVFTVKPDRRQMALPASTVDNIAQALREEDIWRNAAGALGVNKEGDTTVSNPLSLDVNREQLLRMRLEVVVRKPMPWVMFNLWSSIPAVSGTSPLPQIIGQYFYAEGSTSDPDAPKDTSPAITFSDLGKRDLELARQVTENQPAIELATEDVGRMTDPVANEPLATFVSDELSGWADAKKVSLLVEVPDAFWVAALVAAPDGKTTVQRVDRMLHRNDLGTDLNEFGGWATVTCAPSGWLSWADRRTVKEIIDRFRSTGRFGLDDRATLTFYGVERRSEWPMMVLMALDKTVMASSTSANDRAYVLWGSLSKGQRAKLRQEHHLSYQELDKEQAKLVEEIVYSDMFDGSVRGESNWTAMVKGERADPTDVCPDGVPPTTYLRLNERSFQRVWAYAGSANKPAVLQVYERAEAARIMKMDSGQRAEWFDGRPQPTGFAVRTEKLVDLDVVVGPRWWHSFRLSDGYEKPSRAPVPYDQLPEDAKKGPTDFGG